MKHKIIFSMILFSSYSYAQMKTEPGSFIEVNTTLVNRQLSPELIKLEYDGSVGEGTLKTPEGQQVNSFRQSILTLSTFPAALIHERNTQVYMGLGYVDQKFSDFTTEAYTPLFSQDIKSIFLGTALIEKLGRRTFWLNYLQTGLNGTQPFQNLDKTLNIVFSSKFDFKATRNLNLGLGIVYFSNMGYPLILPAVTFSYSQPKFVLNLDFPVKTEAEALLNRGKIRPVVGLSYHGGNYYLKDQNQYLYNFGALGYVGAKFKILDFLYLYTAYQTGVNDQFKIAANRNLNPVGSYAGQKQFLVSLNFQVEKFIPLLQH